MAIYTDTYEADFEYKVAQARARLQSRARRTRMLITYSQNVADDLTRENERIFGDFNRAFDKLNGEWADWWNSVELFTATYSYEDMPRYAEVVIADLIDAEALAVGGILGWFSGLWANLKNTLLQ